ncbi:hypothetical protein JCM10908_002903 [Rhodotorula pacifica]|uniref:F-box protein n=1 Tax=Rhodotorula pacifica TaxID=1495444 RepID=UPI0031730D5E
MVSSSPPPPSSRPLFYSPSPPPKNPEPASASPASPAPRRRLPLSPRTSAKRSPAGSKPWTRRLTFAGSPPSASAVLASISPAKNVGEDATASGLSTAQGPGAGGAKDTPAPDTFNLSALAIELDQIAAQAAPSKAFQSKLFASAHRVRAPVRARTSINDLPDEVLLGIFGFLDDQLGYRALPTRVPGSPEWSFPPLRIARVCKRWHPLSRYLFYRSMRIAHLSRISSLHRAFGLNPELATHIRHLVINLPTVHPADLEQVPDAIAKVEPANSRGTGTDSEADPQSRPGTPPPLATEAESPTKTKKKKPAAPPTYADQLRTVFQSCAFLLSLEIVGIPPATLFVASSTGATSSLHRLHQLRLSTVASLTLRASEDTEPLKAVALRDALLALTGLRRLALKGYASALAEADKLDFSPTRTSLGHVARPLPTRTRSSRLLPLERFELVECSFSPADLESLLRHCRERTLRFLVVEDRYTSARAAQLRKLGFSNAPTVEALPRLVDLVKHSLTGLKVSLYNYPLLTGATTVTASGSTAAASRTGAPPATSTKEAPPHVLDDFVAQLENLRVLDVGGTVLTPALFEVAPVPISNQLPSRPRPPRLPSTVQTLTIRACPLLTSPALLPFLTSLGPLSSRRSHTSTGTNLSDSTANAAGSSHLSTLYTVGGSEHGWSRPTNAWSIQRACWDAGIKWSSGASSALGRDEAHIAEVDSPKFWVQGYGPASRTGGAW